MKIEDKKLIEKEIVDLLGYENRSMSIREITLSINKKGFKISQPSMKKILLGIEKRGLIFEEKSK